VFFRHGQVVKKLPGAVFPILCLISSRLPPPPSPPSIWLNWIPTSKIDILVLSGRTHGSVHLAYQEMKVRIQEFKIQNPKEYLHSNQTYSYYILGRTCKCAPLLKKYRLLREYIYYFTCRYLSSLKFKVYQQHFFILPWDS
jgi:hypothetical protein